MTAAVTPVLELLRGQSEALFGDARAQLEPVAILDRPYSTVIRVRITMPEQPPSYAFAKIYKARTPAPYEVARPTADLVREEFAATSRLHEILEGRPGLHSPRPIASLPEHGVIMTEEIEGMPLDQVLRRPPRRRGTARRLAAVATRIGTWLRTYQRIAAPAGTWSADEGRAYLDDRLRYMCPRVLGPRARAQALDLFDRLAAHVRSGAEPLVPIHADLCPANILVGRDGGIAVIDFATTQAGTRLHDLAHLYLHFELARRQRTRRALGAAMQDAMLAAFDSPAVGRDPLFRLMLLQHVVCHVTQVVDGGARAPRMVLNALARWRWRTCFAFPALTDPVAPVTLQAA